VVANAIAADHFSAVLDLKLFRKGEAMRFMTDFLETLYRNNRDPIHLFIDEADICAPQKPFGDQARLLGATEDIVRRGRLGGIGCTLITQRPQVLNKNVLSQVDMLTALRMNHPKDLANVKEWVDVHADADAAREMIKSLPSLPIGTAWFWNPAEDIFVKAMVRKRRTYDSGRTPKAGERVVAPKVLATVDIDALGKTIAATVDKLKDNDPKVLRARLAEQRVRIAELEAKVQERSAQDWRGSVTVRGALEAMVDAASESDARMRALVTKAQEALRRIADPLTAPRGPESPVSTPNPPPIRSCPLGLNKESECRTRQAVAQRELGMPGAPCPQHGATLSNGERKILVAIAQHGAGGAPKSKVALLTGYKATGGGFNNYLGALRSRHFITGNATLCATDAGVGALGAFDSMPTGQALFDHWMRKLGKAERTILTELVDQLPRAASKETIAHRTGYAPDGGGFNNAIGRLRTLNLIGGTRDTLVAAQEFAGAKVSS